MDRISQLPECIIHRILSCFNNSHKALVRMSVLSKNWFNQTASFPNLDFNMHHFKGLSRESFFKYVEYTTSRFCHQNVTANTLKIVTTTFLNPAELDIVNRCIELVLNKGVQVLVIDITNNSDLQKYRLPDILLSVSELKSLTIANCELPSSLMVDVVKFTSLIQLTLVNVQIGDEVIKYLTTSCPLLQVFKMNMCDGFKRFCVNGHQNLEKLFITWNTQIERIDIESPNLSTLMIIDIDEHGAPRMNFGSCKKLTTVGYMGHLLLNSNDYNDFLSNFPFIQNLMLVSKCNNLKFSSHSLKILILHSNCDLEDIEFTTPNLNVFIYSYYNTLLYPLISDMLRIWPPVRYATNLKSRMECHLDSFTDALWFNKLRLFLDKKKGFKVLNLYIHAIYTQKCTNLENLKAIELPPYKLENVELRLNNHEESSAHIAFVDALLWCCRPRSLTLRSSIHLTDFEDVVKFTNNKLLQQEHEGHTIIQTVLPGVLPSERNAIMFKKEKFIQEETG